jgi:hypothetical protein
VGRQTTLEGTQVETVAVLVKQKSQMGRVELPKSIANVTNFLYHKISTPAIGYAVN